MSGGHFNYLQHRILEQSVEASEILCNPDYDFTPETIEEALGIVYGYQRQALLGE